MTGQQVCEKEITSLEGPPALRGGPEGTAPKGKENFEHPTPAPAS